MGAPTMRVSSMPALRAGPKGKAFSERRSKSAITRPRTQENTSSSRHSGRSRNRPRTNSSFKDSAGTIVPNVEFVFTNYEYGVRDAYFSLKDSANKEDGILRMRNLENGNVVELVNTGAYPDMKIGDFQLEYKALGKDENGNTTGGYFTVEYKVFSKKDSNLTKEVQCIIRCMNRV